MKEDANYAVLGEAVSKQENYRAWQILDSSAFWEGFRQMLTPSQMFSLFGTPAFLNILFGGMRRADNQDAPCGRDPLGKRKENLAPIGMGPYYAVNMSPRNK